MYMFGTFTDKYLIFIGWTEGVSTWDLLLPYNSLSTNLVLDTLTFDFWLFDL